MRRNNSQQPAQEPVQPRRGGCSFKLVGILATLGVLIFVLNASWPFYGWMLPQQAHYWHEYGNSFEQWQWEKPDFVIEAEGKFYYPVISWIGYPNGKMNPQQIMSIPAGPAPGQPAAPQPAGQPGGPVQMAQYTPDQLPPDDGWRMDMQCMHEQNVQILYEISTQNPDLVRIQVVRDAPGPGMAPIVEEETGFVSKYDPGAVFYSPTCSVAVRFVAETAVQQGGFIQQQLVQPPQSISTQATRRPRRGRRTDERM